MTECRPVEPLRVHAVQVPHGPRQIRPARVHDQVVVVDHQTTGKHGRIEPAHCVGQRRQKRVAIDVVHKDRFAVATARSQVVDGAWEFAPKMAGHGRMKVGVTAKVTT